MAQNPMKVLVVDAALGIRIGIGIFFEDYFPTSEVTFAASGTDATRKINGGYFDLMIVEFEISGTDGLDVILTAFAIQGRHSRVIAMSRDREKFFSAVGTRVEKDDVVLELENRFLEKPFPLSVLKAMVRKIMSG